MKNRPATEAFRAFEGSEALAERNDFLRVFDRQDLAVAPHIGGTALELCWRKGGRGLLQIVAGQQRRADIGEIVERKSIVFCARARAFEVGQEHGAV